MRSIKSRKCCKGFTLLEVIIALGIVAVGILAVSKAITGFAETTITLEQRMLASWVASNRLETLRILKSSPVPGTTHGSEEMADRVWYFRETTTATADPYLFRIDITVFTDQEETVEAGSLYGYLLNSAGLTLPVVSGRGANAVGANLFIPTERCRHCTLRAFPTARLRLPFGHEQPSAAIHPHRHCERSAAISLCIARHQEIASSQAPRNDELFETAYET